MQESPRVGTPAGMRELNQQAVLARLREKGAATRPRIAEDTGLSKPTVGQSLLDLEKRGLVRTTGRSTTGTGRSAVVYEADPTAGYVLGVDIGRRMLRLAVADLAGTTVAELERPNRARSSAALLRAVRDCAGEAVRRAGLAGDELAHVVIGTPGVPDQAAGCIRHAPNLPGWQRPGLLGELTTIVPAPVTVENDANLHAVGEYTGGAARGARVAVCVTVGTGIGMGVLVDGVLFRGAHGAAGEIGHLPYGWPGTDGAGGGMLESAAAARSVVDGAARRGLAGVRSAAEVFRLARTGDPRATAVVEEEAERLAFVLCAVVAVLDPEVVVLGGGVGHNDLLIAPLLRTLGDRLPVTPRIVAGELGDRAVLAGALATALDTARESVLPRRHARTAGIRVP